MIEELERASERGGFSVLKIGRESKHCVCKLWNYFRIMFLKNKIETEYLIICGTWYHQNIQSNLWNVSVLDARDLQTFYIMRFF